MNFKKIFALSAAAVLALSMTACGKNDDDDDDEESTPAYEKPVEAFFDNTMKLNIENAKSNLFFEEELEYIQKNQFSDDEEQLDEYVEEMFSGFDYDFESEFGEGYKISYKVVDKERFDDEMTDDCNSHYSQYFEDENFEIDGGYTMDVEVTVRADGESYVAEWEFVVVEIDGDWGLGDWDEDWDFEEKSVGGNDELHIGGDSSKEEGKSTGMTIDIDVADIEDMEYEDIMEAVPMY